MMVFKKVFTTTKAEPTTSLLCGELVLIAVI